ncbi:hypothetical protein HZ326_7508 [Fusarium oxysporum f. sp. albedinis]|nr:hypothetical protein HZ326_7508 [Fusarium oxysporum f. sp. albedinis]
MGYIVIQGGTALGPEHPSRGMLTEASLPGTTKESSDDRGIDCDLTSDVRSVCKAELLVQQTTNTKVCTEKKIQQLRQQLPIILLLMIAFMINSAAAKLPPIQRSLTNVPSTHVPVDQSWLQPASAWKTRLCSRKRAMR